MNYGPTYYGIQGRKLLFQSYIWFLRLLFPILGLDGALVEEGLGWRVCSILLTGCPSRRKPMVLGGFEHLTSRLRGRHAIHQIIY